jgi:hypothetical protein
VNVASKSYVNTIIFVRNMDCERLVLRCKLDVYVRDCGSMRLALYSEKVICNKVFYLIIPRLA